MSVSPPAQMVLESNQDSPVQQIVLDQSGRVLASDDLIFSTKNWDSEPVFGRFPFFEGIWPSLFPPPKKDGETVFNGIQMAVPELPGIYDFHFSPIFWNAEPALNCSIVERTGHYQLHREAQQVEKDTALTAEKAALAR